MLNQVARRTGARVSEVRIASGNRITASAAGPFGIRIPLDATIVDIDASLEVVVQFHGFLVANALSVLARWLPEGTRVDRGRLHVDLSRLPQLAPWRPALRHLQSVSINTRPGLMVIDLKVVVR